MGDHPARYRDSLFINLNVETKERELKNLLVVSEELGCDNLTVITDD